VRGLPVSNEVNQTAD